MEQKADPEIAAMAAIASALTPLDVSARCRVVAWAMSRWGTGVSIAPRAGAAFEFHDASISMEQKADPEIAAMAAITSALTPLDVNARCRVVEWAMSRWGKRVEVAPQRHPSDPAGVSIVPLAGGGIKA